MKKYNHRQTTAALLTAALLMAGCSKQLDDNRPQNPAEPSPLEVQVTVAAQSRGVVTGTAFTNGRQINIILKDADATTIYQGASQPYEFRKTSDTDPGMWIPTQSSGIMVEGEVANVRAHYPATLPPSEAALSGDSTKINVTLPASRDFGSIDGVEFESFNMTLKTGDTPAEILVCRSETDILTGTGTQVSTAEGNSKATTISMKHALAMVIVYVKKSPALQVSPSVKAITIQNSGANTPLVQGSFALTDNAFTPNATPATYTRTMSGFPIDVVRYAMLVYPSTMTAGGAEMLLTTNEETYAIQMPAKEWKSGFVYIYNVEISVNEAQIGSVTLAPWPEWIDKPFDLD